VTDHLDVFGKYSDKVLANARFSIYPCVLPSGCAQPSDVIRFSFLYSEMVPSLNLSDYKQPVKYSLNSENYNYISTTNGQKIQRTLRSISIIDTRGFFSGESSRVNYADIDQEHFNIFSRDQTKTSCSPTELGYPTCKAYYIVDTASGGTTVKYTRTFRGIIDTIGNIGGVIEMIYLVAFCLYFFYNKHSTKIFLLENVYDIKINSKSYKYFRCCWKKRKLHIHESSLSSLPTLASADGKTISIDEQLDKAYLGILNKLNIVEILREFNSLQLLSKAFLDERHLKLAPMLALNREIQNSDKNIKVNNSHHDTLAKQQSQLAERRSSLLPFKSLAHPNPHHSSSRSIYTKILSKKEELSDPKSHRQEITKNCLKDQILHEIDDACEQEINAIPQTLEMVYDLRSESQSNQSDKGDATSLRKLQTAYHPESQENLALHGTARPNPTSHKLSRLPQNPLRRISRTTHLPHHHHHPA